MLYVMRLTQNQERLNKLNTAVKWCCWKRLLCSIFYFRISIFDPMPQTVQKEGSYYLLKRTKNNWNIPVQNSAAVKASTNYKKYHSTLQLLRKKKNSTFLLYIPGKFSDMLKYFCEWWWYKGDPTKILIGIPNVLFLELVLCAVLFS